MSEANGRWKITAEFLSIGAIILSLFFVGLELNENTKATRSATASDASIAMMEWYSAIGTSKEATSEFWTFIIDPESMEPERQLQGIFLLHGALIVFQNSFYLVEEGTLDEAIRSTITEAIVPIRDTPGWALYWSQRRAFFMPEFRDYVESLLVENREARESIYLQEQD